MKKGKLGVEFDLYSYLEISFIVILTIFFSILVSTSAFAEQTVDCECSCSWNGYECFVGYILTNNCDSCHHAQCTCSGSDEASCESPPDSCSCVLSNPDDYSSACSTSCFADQTTGDFGMAFGSSLFGTGNYGTSDCCGDDANEYYIDSGSNNRKGCCNSSTDCVASDYGSCFNSWTVSGSSLCDKTEWYECSSYTTTIYYDGESEACCPSGTWDTTCSCDEYQSICEGASCNGDWILHGVAGESCCENGAGFYLQEKADCGSLTPACPSEDIHAGCLCNILP